MLDFIQQELHHYPQDQTISIRMIPSQRFIGLQGEGQLDRSNPDFVQAKAALYALIEAIQRSEQQGQYFNGFEAFVRPPLEWLIWPKTESNAQQWELRLRLPEFVDSPVIAWAVAMIQSEHPQATRIKCFDYQEGLVIQGLYLSNQETLAERLLELELRAAASGFQIEYTAERTRHELLYEVENAPARLIRLPLTRG